MMQAFCSCSGRVTTALGAQTSSPRTQPICRPPHSHISLSDRVYQLQSGHHSFGSCCAAQRRYALGPICADVLLHRRGRSRGERNILQAGRVLPIPSWHRPPARTGGLVSRKGCLATTWDSSSHVVSSLGMWASSRRSRHQI